MGHIRPLYKYVHSLHHKNTDPEPWSGLCMHPIEHLYYFSCTALPAFFLQSPFHVMYSGQHAMLSPAEAHSGWEDHNGGDLMHYIHHAKFECNYGDGSFVMDKIFGTFRDSLEKPAKVITDDGIAYERFDDDRAMTGAQQRKKPHPSKPRNTASSKPAAPASSNKRGSGRLVTPKRSAGIQATCYFMFTFGLFGVLAGAIGDVWGARAFANVAGLTFEQAIPIAVAFGPIAFGVFLLKVFGDTYSIIWPFQSEPFTAFGLHLSVGFCFGVLPVYLVTTLALGPPNDASAWRFLLV